MAREGQFALCARRTLCPASDLITPTSQLCTHEEFMAGTETGIVDLATGFSHFFTAADTTCRSFLTM